MILPVVSRLAVVLSCFKEAPSFVFSREYGVLQGVQVLIDGLVDFFIISEELVNVKAEMERRVDQSYTTGRMSLLAFSRTTTLFSHNYNAFKLKVVLLRWHGGILSSCLLCSTLPKMVSK